MSRIPSASPSSQCGFAAKPSSRFASSRSTGLSCSSFPGGTSGARSFGIHSAWASRSSVIGPSSVSICLMRSPISRIFALTASDGGPPLLALFRSACSCSFSACSLRTWASSSSRRSRGASKWRAASIARTRSGSSRTRWMADTVMPLSAVVWNVVLVAFEGPDRYSFVGGLATRMNDLAASLVARGHRVRHLFVGDPTLPHIEERASGALTLERWSQWISVYHPKDVYDGEDGKYLDFSRTVPPHLVDVVAAAANARERSVLLFEDWQCAAAAIGTASLLLGRGLRAPVFWNANNTYGFGRVDFPLLRRVASITTISRFMRMELLKEEVESAILPNGLADRWLAPVGTADTAVLRASFGDRPTFAKVARFDADKRWLWAIDAVAAMRDDGLRPRLV